MSHNLYRGVVLAAALVAGLTNSSQAKVIRVGQVRGAGGLGKVSEAAVSAAIERAALELRAGDALLLPEGQRFGAVRLAKLPENVQIIGGRGDEIRIDGLAKGTVLFGGSFALTAEGANSRMADAFIIHQQGEIRATGGTVENTYWIDHIGGVSIQATMRNCTGLWMRYNHEGARTATPSMLFDLNGSGQNVKMLMLVEHNQGNRRPAVRLVNAVGMQLSHGATEGCSAYYTQEPYVYELRNCTNVYLGCRRFFAGHQESFTPLADGGGSWAGLPVMTLGVSGEGNVLDNLVDIGNPMTVSMTSSDPKLQIWATCLENQERVVGSRERFLFSYVTDAIPGYGSWSTGTADQRLIDKEMVLAYETADTLIDLTVPGATLPTGVCYPSPPSVPKCDIPKPPDLLYKAAAGFGAAALEAGADPTGARNSDAAFARVLSERNILELAPGTYRISRPLDVRAMLRSGTGVYGGSKAWIAGSGRGRTRIVYGGAGAALTFDMRSSGLARTVPGAHRAGRALVVTDLTVEGGDYGFMLKGAADPDYILSISGFNIFQMNVAYENYTIAGVYKSGWGEPEQSRWVGCTFSGGQYGFYYHGYMDKYLLYRCHFANHSKGGIYCEYVHNLQTGVYQCDFEDITGPGVAFLGGKKEGYGGYCYRIDNCTFTNCGSETEPVIHNGFGWLGVVSNCTIANTDTRPIYAAFRGNFAVIENFSVDLPSLVNDTVMYLGHQRYEMTAGVGGSRLVNVDIKKGDIAFLPIEFMNEVTWDFNDGQGEVPVGLYTYADGSTMYSDKPWAFTYMFYNVKSDNFPTAQYALVKDGAVAVDLAPFACNVGVKAGPAPEAVRASRATGTTGAARQYDLCGRRLPHRVGAVAGTLPLVRGVRVTRGEEGRVVRVLR